jgi:hypothetical protein
MSEEKKDDSDWDDSGEDDFLINTNAKRAKISNNQEGEAKAS